MLRAAAAGYSKQIGELSEPSRVKFSAAARIRRRDWLDCDPVASRRQFAVSRRKRKLSSFVVVVGVVVCAVVVVVGGRCLNTQGTIELGSIALLACARARSAYLGDQIWAITWLRRRRRQ